MSYNFNVDNFNNRKATLNYKNNKINIEYSKNNNIKVLITSKTDKNVFYPMFPRIEKSLLNSQKNKKNKLASKSMNFNKEKQINNLTTHLSFNPLLLNLNKDISASIEKKKEIIKHYYNFKLDNQKSNLSNLDTSTKENISNNKIYNNYSTTSELININTNNFKNQLCNIVSLKNINNFKNIINYDKSVLNLYKVNNNSSELNNNNFNKTNLDNLCNHNSSFFEQQPYDDNEVLVKNIVTPKASSNEQLTMKLSDNKQKNNNDDDNSIKNKNNSQVICKTNKNIAVSPFKQEKQKQRESNIKSNLLKIFENKYKNKTSKLNTNNSKKLLTNINSCNNQSENHSFLLQLGLESLNKIDDYKKLKTQNFNSKVDLIVDDKEDACLFLNSIGISRRKFNIVFNEYIIPKYTINLDLLKSFGIKLNHISSLDEIYMLGYYKSLLDKRLKLENSYRSK